VAARAHREDVEDQAGAVDHAALGQLLEVALLYRAERMIDENEVGIECGALLAQLFRLAGADVVARVRTIDARSEAADDACAGGPREFGEFIERERIDPTRSLRLKQKRALAFSGSLKQRKSPACCGTPWDAAGRSHLQGPARLTPRRLPRAAPAPLPVVRRARHRPAR
jgi:hypothetical protein